MNTVVYKYAVDSEVRMPANAQVLTAQIQNGEVQLWAMVDPSAPLETRRFEVYGTGQEFAKLESHESRCYRGTVPTIGGRLVLHVFEVES